MNKELLAEVIKVIEGCDTLKSEVKYPLLKKLYLEEVGETKNVSAFIKRVSAIQAIDEVVRLIYIGELPIESARNFSQTKSCQALLNK